MYDTQQQSAVVMANSSLEPKHILVVDDDPVFRRVTTNFLTHQGYRVTESENGLDGLQSLSSEVPDLVLCDLSMPILDGIEFVEEVQLEYPSLPIIVVSGTEQMSEVAKALRFGIKDFLPKPIENYRHLLSAVDNTLEDSTSLLHGQRDFSAQWFRVEGGGEVPEEQELHWHLDYLQNNPSAARDLLHALLPEKDTSQGNWKCNYRLLQSSTNMPLVFDYAWVMNGQFAFYLVDADSAEDAVGSVLLIRALFDDYLRNTRSMHVDLKEVAMTIEKGLCCSDETPAVNALFGVADLTDGSVSIMPAGIESTWAVGQHNHKVESGNQLGDHCAKNFVTTGLEIGSSGQLRVSKVGAVSFNLEIKPMQ
ncbi:response regulator [Vibrio maerlii]|uniref:response regulator n=1 Tax=Vibrio maerlii TaxID=2231648 RepID=UPI000E3BCA6A|nr:response regulator [Vibrio maerlii]